MLRSPMLRGAASLESIIHWCVACKYEHTASAFLTRPCLCTSKLHPHSSLGFAFACVCEQMARTKQTQKVTPAMVRQQQERKLQEAIQQTTTFLEDSGLGGQSHRKARQALEAADRLPRGFSGAEVCPLCPDLPASVQLKLTPGVNVVPLYVRAAGVDHLGGCRNGRRVGSHEG